MTLQNKHLLAAGLSANAGLRNKRTVAISETASTPGNLTVWQTRDDRSVLQAGHQNKPRQRSMKASAAQASARSDLYAGAMSACASIPHCPSMPGHWHTAVPGTQATRPSNSPSNHQRTVSSAFRPSTAYPPPSYRHSDPPPQRQCCVLLFVCPLCTTAATPAQHHLHTPRHCLSMSCLSKHQHPKQARVLAMAFAQPSAWQVPSSTGQTKHHGPCRAANKGHGVKKGHHVTPTTSQWHDSC